MTSIKQRDELQSTIWKIANEVRGAVDGWDFKQFVLGTLFYRFISENFTNFIEGGDESVNYANMPDDVITPEIKDDATRTKGYFIYPAQLFVNIAKNADNNPNLNTDLAAIFDAIESSANGYPSEHDIKGLFADFDTTSNRLGNTVEEKNRRLAAVIKGVESLDFGNFEDNEIDLFGDAYEFLISNYAANAGKSGGEFFTPSCVLRTLVEVWKPFKGRVYDPCCGSGGMFVQSAKFIENHSGNISNISIYGQDSNPTTWKMAQMNLAIRGIEPDLGTYAADTFLDDRHPTLRADYIMANPPFNLSDWGLDKLKEDQRWKYGIPPAGNANFAWLQHMIYHLAPAGRIGMVLANGSLSSQSGGEGEIRKNIINADLVECIVAMPTQLFYTTQIPVSLWFINKQKKQPGRTLFIDARKMGKMVSRKLRELTDDDIKKISDTYEAFVDGTLENVKGYCAVTDTAEIEKQDYILTPGRYVGIEEQEADDEPFEEKMDRLTSELAEMFAKSHELEDEIRKKLGAIGYEV